MIAFATRDDLATEREEWLRRKLSGDDTSMEEGWWNVGRRRYDQAVGDLNADYLASPEEWLHAVRARKSETRPHNKRLDNMGLNETDNHAPEAVTRTDAVVLLALGTAFVAAVMLASVRRSGRPNIIRVAQSL